MQTSRKLGEKCLVMIISCVLLTSAYPAPLSERSYSSDHTLDIKSHATQGFRRGRRDTSAGKETQPVRSLIRYRYPIHKKHSAFSNSSGQVELEDEESDLILRSLGQLTAIRLIMESKKKNERNEIMGKLLKQLDYDDGLSHSGYINNNGGRFMYQHPPTGLTTNIDLVAEDSYGRPIIRGALTEEHIDKEEPDAEMDEPLASLKLSSEYMTAKKRWIPDWKQFSRWRSRSEYDAVNDRARSDQNHAWKTLKEVPYGPDDEISGRGFHRVLRGIRDQKGTFSKGNQYPSMSENFIAIQKRSEHSTLNQNDHNSLLAREDASSIPGLMNTFMNRPNILTSDARVSKFEKDSSDRKNSSHPNSDQKENYKIVNEEIHKPSGSTKFLKRKETEKTVDWGDYFGYDKRTGEKNQDVRGFLEPEYLQMKEESLPFFREFASNGKNGPEKKPSSLLDSLNFDGVLRREMPFSKEKAHFNFQTMNDLNVDPMIERGNQNNENTRQADYTLVMKPTEEMELNGFGSTWKNMRQDILNGAPAGAKNEEVYPALVDHSSSNIKTLHENHQSGEENLNILQIIPYKLKEESVTNDYEEHYPSYRSPRNTYTTDPVEMLLPSSDEISAAGIYFLSK